MGGRGITGLILLTKSKKQIEFNKFNLKNVISPTWTKCKEINNDTEDGRQLICGDLSMHDYILDKYDNNTIELKEAIGFFCNGNMIKFNELYPNRYGKSGYNVCFEKHNNHLSLLVIGSKNPKEIEYSNYDYDGRSRIPIVITCEKVYDQNALIPINL